VCFGDSYKQQLVLLPVSYAQSGFSESSDAISRLNNQGNSKLGTTGTFLAGVSAGVAIDPSGNTWEHCLFVLHGSTLMCVFPPCIPSGGIGPRSSVTTATRDFGAVKALPSLIDGLEVDSRDSAESL